MFPFNQNRRNRGVDAIVSFIQSALSSTTRKPTNVAPNLDK